MKLTLVIYGSPSNSQAAATAYRYAEAALTKGHEIVRVFFYGDAVNTGNALATPPQDEISVFELWQNLGKTHDLDLVVCIAAALKRGVIDAGEAKRFEKAASNLGDAFSLSGLGQLIDGCQQADRVITFAA